MINATLWYLCRYEEEEEKKNLYLPSAVFTGQVVVGPSKQLKQIIQTEHNIVKNPNWPEANQLAWLFTSVAEDLNLGLLPRNKSR